MPFAGNRGHPMPPGSPFNLLDYIELLDWTGRQVREGKRGSIDANVPPVLQRLDISPDHWLELCTNFEDRFKGLVGSRSNVARQMTMYCAQQLGDHSLKDIAEHFSLTNSGSVSHSISAMKTSLRGKSFVRNIGS